MDGMVRSVQARLPARDAMTAAVTTAATVRDHRLGFSSLDQELELDELAIRGDLPPWLTGSLLRTGPARFEVGDRPLAHWFDGLAMLHRFSFADGAVSYDNRFLHSRAFNQAERTGRLAFSEFATDPCRSLFKRVASAFSPGTTDNGNVNVSRLGDEFIAMTETPLPVLFDPATLEAAGVAYRQPGPPGPERPSLHPELPLGARARLTLPGRRSPDRPAVRESVHQPVLRVPPRQRLRGGRGRRGRPVRVRGRLDHRRPVPRRDQARASPAARPRAAALPPRPRDRAGRARAARRGEPRAAAHRLPALQRTALPIRLRSRTGPGRLAGPDRQGGCPGARREGLARGRLLPRRAGVRA